MKRKVNKGQIYGLANRLLSVELYCHHVVRMRCLLRCWSVVNRTLYFMISKNNPLYYCVIVKHTNIILNSALREGRPAPTPSPAFSPGPEAWSIVANLMATPTLSGKKCFVWSILALGWKEHASSKCLFVYLQVLPDSGEGVCWDCWGRHHDQGPRRLHSWPVQVSSSLVDTWVFYKIVVHVSVIYF